MEERFLVYKTNKVVRKVALDEILYIESSGRRIKLETENESLLYYEKMSNIADVFDERFYRPMSYCYINMSKVRLMSSGIVNFHCGKALVLCRESFIRAKKAFYLYLRKKDFGV
ncbi:MAG: LytTR family transcriptional regulator DNA-binding domain-containing protein [Eubacterium sp.]|nr:LytTR family transcriptional regulator DNA-binding domain-containing protein [Eubacterium sp.]